MNTSVRFRTLAARQVGKSTAVRQLARQVDHFLEINFEEQRQVSGSQVFT